MRPFLLSLQEYRLRLGNRSKLHCTHLALYFIRSYVSSVGLSRQRREDGGRPSFRILSAVLVKSSLKKLYFTTFYLLRFASLAFRLSQYVIDRADIFVNVLTC